jgi:hypothetical protein
MCTLIFLTYRGRMSWRTPCTPPRSDGTPSPSSRRRPLAHHQSRSSSSSVRSSTSLPRAPPASARPREPSARTARPGPRPPRAPYSVRPAWPRGSQWCWCARRSTAAGRRSRAWPRTSPSSCGSQRTRNAERMPPASSRRGWWWRRA